MQQETLAQIIRRTVREFEQQQELEARQQQAVAASVQTASAQTIRRRRKTRQLASVD